MVSYIFLGLVGILTGILGSIIGLGGGVIMLPAVQMIMGYEPVIAIGTTLFAVVFTSFSAALGHFRAGNVRLKSGLWVGAGGLAGVLGGSYIFKHYLSTSTSALEYVLGTLFLVMAIKMGKEVFSELWSDRNGNLEKDEGRQALRDPVPSLFLLGMVTGSLTGMLGIGGGFIMVPGMMWLFGASAHVAVGTTMLAMLPIALLGASIKLSQGFVYVTAGLILGIGTALGAQLGVRLSKYLSAVVLKILFAILFMILSVDYLFPILMRLI